LSAINYPMATYVFLIHALACWGLALTFSSQSKTLAWGFILWPISGFGITGGAHRLWAHKAYKAYMPYRIVTMIANSIANQGTLYHWTRDHRTHHLHSETDADPHNALRGFFFAHVGWLLLKKRAAVYEAGKKVDMSDILTDPVCEIQRKLDPLWNMFWCFIMPALVAKYGWGETFGKGLLVCGFLRYCIWSWTHVRETVFRGTDILSRNPFLYFTSAEKIRLQPDQTHQTSEDSPSYLKRYAFDYAASELGIHYQFNPTKLIIDFGWLIGQTYDHRQVKRM
ncbi:hypothetical protein T492DRAFT_589895, partial [Pavlovales sp. CCMP2436]